MTQAFAGEPELEAKDDKALLDDAQLGRINDRLQELQEAKSQAESRLSEAEASKSDAEAKVAVLQSIVDKMPAHPTATPGSDTRTEKTFEDAWKESDTYKEACAELGVVA